MDTISIEDFAKYVKSSFVTFFTNLIWASLIAAAPWVGAPVISKIVKYVIELLVTFLATKGGLVAFMINTKVFTTAQARDYGKAIEVLHARVIDLKTPLSDEEWDKLETIANHEFSNLVRFAA